MPKPRRAQPSKFRVDFTDPAWSDLGPCPACKKKIYRSKKAAKNAARAKHPNDKMSPYQCRSKSALRPNPAPWHLGHLMDEIKRGDSDRYSLYVNHEMPKAKQRHRVASGGSGTDYLRSLAKSKST